MFEPLAAVIEHGKARTQGEPVASSSSQKIGQDLLAWHEVEHVMFCSSASPIAAQTRTKHVGRRAFPAVLDDSNFDSPR